MSRQKVLFLFASGLLLLSLACSSLSRTASTATTGVDFSSLAATNDAVMGTIFQTIGTEPSMPGDATPAPNDNAPAATTSGPQNAKVGDVVLDGDLRLVVGGWTKVEPTDTIQPDSGNRIVAVDLTLVYAGKKTFDFSEMDFLIKDSDSREYNKTIDVNPLVNAMNFGTMFQGERLHTVIGFQVPQNSTGLTLVYDGDSYYGYSKAFIALGDQPGVQPVPANLPGELKPSVSAFNQPASCLKWNIQLYETKEAAPNQMLTMLLPAGMNVLLTDLSLENTDSVTHNFSNYNMIWVQDGSGWHYPFSWFTSQAVTSNSLDSLSQLVAGEKSRGWMGFIAPEDVDPGALMLVFWCGGEEYPYSMDKVFLALK